VGCDFPVGRSGRFATCGIAGSNLFAGTCGDRAQHGKYSSGDDRDLGGLGIRWSCGWLLFQKAIEKSGI
jgi:hypothetical protein